MSMRTGPGRVSASVSEAVPALAPVATDAENPAGALAAAAAGAPAGVLSGGAAIGCADPWPWPSGPGDGGSVSATGVCSVVALANVTIAMSSTWKVSFFATGWSSTWKSRDEPVERVTYSAATSCQSDVSGTGGDSIVSPTCEAPANSRTRSLAEPCDPPVRTQAL